ncbi:1-aminocyclopropane-1-carboxylate deaminase/D-cysteine desulfhydrase [Fuchsiella alkaliacetigena]|uniref:1-aminocyclopropane-1-carboxylate deaminase/D-cysteine desulfhydrase n=1 Tax=Fuchsiella alkaliacetigena TaxID=957042 RepID=UPI00200A45E3|nr:D-cysteine desulfhydrase family protein [Fuchsiella alkaliacetigena]MCK8824337.1 D-cysteine desulfhydrase family protein [Fuchsiella alkaliacetigena]
MKIDKLDFIFSPTDLYKINICFDKSNNDFYIKRDDLTGLAMGGNKARKLEYFIQDALDQEADYIVTYGSTQSNHCAMTAAAASKLNLPCLLVLAKPDKEPTYTGNFFLYDLFDAEIVYTSTEEVSETIDEEIEKLSNKGYNPYFIYGGGHGNLGTHAYVEAYQEIISQAEDLEVNFDYIFFASGTGTTQAGLIIGKELQGGSEEIIGISIARDKQRGTDVISDSIKDYCNQFNIEISNIERKINFIDSYIGEGYGIANQEVLKTIKLVAKKEGILLDPTYTGKAFSGMLDYIEKNKIKDKNILFIHTGGTSILLDNTEQFKEIEERI